MAEKLEIQQNTVKQRLFQKGIKPLAKDAIYEAFALEEIREAPMGRPKKVPNEGKEEGR